MLANRLFGTALGVSFKFIFFIKAVGECLKLLYTIGPNLLLEWLNYENIKLNKLFISEVSLFKMVIQDIKSKLSFLPSPISVTVNTELSS